MTADEASALDDVLTALALIAQDLERAGAVLDALSTGVPVAELPGAVESVGAKVAHAYRVAAAARTRWAA